MTTIEFRAPWSNSLLVVTCATLALLAVGIAVAVFVTPPLFVATLSVLALLLIAVGLAGRVRGYTLTEEAVTVRRGMWNTRLPLAGLRSVTGDIEAMRGAIRLLIIDGVFSFTGRYWSMKLGWYRALVTDPSRAVVLRYADRKIVISPHDPQQFIMRAGTFIKTAGFPK